MALEHSLTWKQRLQRTWLGSDHSAVNYRRFWVYLGFLAVSLCLICLVRAVKTMKS